LAIYSANSLNRALFPATLKLEKETYRMKRLILAFGLSMMLSGCVTATLATAVVKTTAAVVALPVKAVGAAAKAITPDGEESDEKGDESD
jgi:uncharacterized protein YaaW (UPF0174 family)